jgi:hypothetical protein
MRYFYTCKIRLSISIKLLTFILFAALCINQGCKNETVAEYNTPVRHDYSAALNGWISAPFPEDPYKVWAAAGASRSRDEWQVYLDNDVIKIVPYEPNWQGPPVKYILPVSDGKLVGYNRGEWGGDLWWYSEDGKSKYKISDDQIHGFIKTSSDIFGLEGYNHMTFLRGRLVKITKDKDTNKWHSKKFLNFDDLPRAGTLDKNDSMIIVAGNSLVRVSLKGKAQYLVKDGHWGDLIPNSIVVDSNDNFYIGMSIGIITGSLSNPSQIQWLVPNKKTLECDHQIDGNAPQGKGVE